MSNLVVDNINSEDKVNFYIEAEFFDDNVTSPILSFQTPKAAPLMHKVPIFVQSRSAPWESIVSDTKEVNFRKFVKRDLDSNYYMLVLTIGDQEDRGQVSKDDYVRLVSDDPELSDLNGDRFKVLFSDLTSTKKTYQVKLRVGNSKTLNVDSGFVTPETSYLNVEEGRIKRQNFTISVPQDTVFNNLVSVRYPETGTLESSVRDVLIFAYKQYETNAGAIPKKLMSNDAEVTSDPPPDWSDVKDEFFGKLSYSKTFSVRGATNFIFYVAIARYIYKDGKWTGRWLQKNSNNNPIWGRAEPV